MALPPRFALHSLFYPPTSPTIRPHPHTLEFHLDYTCPFSARFFRHLLTALALVPSIPNPYGLNLIFRQQVQPWHPTSTLVHEAALIAERYGQAEGEGWEGNPFWVFSKAAFDHQTEFADHKTKKEGREETYTRLAKLLKDSVGVDEDKAMAELKIKPATAENSGNVGNSVCSLSSCEGIPYFFNALRTRDCFVLCADWPE